MFTVRYVYDNPSAAGPYKGKAFIDAPMKKGDSFSAVMGRATIISCRKKVIDRPPTPGYPPFGDGEGDY